MLAAPLALGEKAPGLPELPGVDGIAYSMPSFHNKQILAVVFVGNGCPTCKVADERLIAIQRDYGDKGVQVIMVNPNNSSISPPDTLKEMVKLSRESKYNFPYLKDEDRTLARSLGATNTPHVFVLDPERRLRYKGRVDYARQISRVTVHDLRNTLDDLLSGRQVRLPETAAFGCGIVW